MADMRVAVLGDSESIKGFAAVGFDIYPVDGAEAAAQKFRAIVSNGDYAAVCAALRTICCLPWCRFPEYTAPEPALSACADLWSRRLARISYSAESNR